MSVVRSGARAPSLVNLAARIGVLGLAVLGAGCASKQAGNFPGDRLGAGSIAPPRVAAAPMKVEIEDDGYPVQVAPRNRRSTPDDPSEPWSPNYGNGAPAAKPVAAPPARAASAGASGIQFVMTAPVPRSAGQRLSAAEEDDIIRRAVAAHEMRRQD